MSCFTVEEIEYYTPFLLVGAVLSTVGLGLMSLLMPHSSAGMWVGFQVIYGIGRGISLSTVSSSICSAPYWCIVSPLLDHKHSAFLR